MKSFKIKYRVKGDMMTWKLWRMFWIIPIELLYKGTDHDKMWSFLQLELKE